MIEKNREKIDKLLSRQEENNTRTNNYDCQDHENYHSSCEKYNGAHGFDDDTIDSVFDGNPDNYWNID